MNTFYTGFAQEIAKLAEYDPMADLDKYMKQKGIKTPADLKPKEAIPPPEPPASGQRATVKVSPPTIKKLPKPKLPTQQQAERESFKTKVITGAKAQKAQMEKSRREAEAVKAKESKLQKGWAEKQKRIEEARRRLQEGRFGEYK